MADHLVFVIASSGVVAEKTGAAMGQYNDAASHARGIASRLGCNNLREVVDLYGSISVIGNSLRSSNSANNDNNEDWVRDMRRVRQFITETDNIAGSLAGAVSVGNVELIKQLSGLSHSLGEGALGNLVEATKWLPRRALQLDAHGSSAFGAGFGGSVWAIVDRDYAPQFLTKWSQDYKEAFPQHSQDAYFFIMRPGPSACRILI
jgi:galactokinase